MRTLSKQNNSEEQDIRQSSEYLNQVASFAEFMYKEHIKQSDGERSLLLCAADGIVDDGTQHNVHIVMGGEKTTIISLSNMMSHEDLRPAFRQALAMARMRDERIDELPTMRQRLRTLYGCCALIAVWTVALILLQVAGFTNWITTASNILMMGFLTLLTVREIRDKRRRIELVSDQERRDLHDHLSIMREALMEAMKKFTGNCDDDDDDD